MCSSDLDNRTGGSFIPLAEACAHATPDGHTLCTSDSFAQSLNPLLFSKLPYEPREFAPIIFIGTLNSVILVNAALPVKTIGEWIAYARSRPGQLMYGSSGQWGGSHLCMEVFNEMAGLKLTHVPYQTVPAAVTGLLGDPERLRAMGGRSRAMGKTDAADTIVRECLTLVRSQE